jgi:hypothetical protein
MKECHDANKKIKMITALVFLARIGQNIHAAD